MSTKWVGILGTWAFQPEDTRREWFEAGSTFSESLKPYGLEPARPHDEFVWSGDLDGTWFANGQDWEAGAVNLAQYLRAMPFEDRNVIAHSHGGTIAIRAAARTPIRSLVTLGTPARKDTRAAGRLAMDASLLGVWVHVSDRQFDLWGQLGALMDGGWRLSRTMAIPGCHDVQLKGIGHSALLSGAHGDRWEREGLFDVLRKGYR